MQDNGFSRDEGEGFLCRDYDSGGLLYGLEKSVRFHRGPRGIKKRQLKKIMNEVRVRYGLEKMADQYIRVYEKLNGEEPLTCGGLVSVWRDGRHGYN